MNRAPRSVTCPICGREFMKHSLKFHINICRELYKKWAGFASMPTPLNSKLLYCHEPVFMNRAFSEDPCWDSREIPTASPQATNSKSLQSCETDDAVRIRCSTCSRQFCSEALARHQPICLRSRSKRRPVFDSARARTRGTDAEFFFRQRAGGAATDNWRRGNWRQQSAEFRNIIRIGRLSENGEGLCAIRECNRPKTALGFMRGCSRRLEVPKVELIETDETMTGLRSRQIRAITCFEAPVYRGRMRPASSPSGYKGARMGRGVGVGPYRGRHPCISSDLKARIADPRRLATDKTFFIKSNLFILNRSPIKRMTTSMSDDISASDKVVALLFSPNSHNGLGRPKTSGGRLMEQGHATCDTKRNAKKKVVSTGTAGSDLADFSHKLEDVALGSGKTTVAPFSPLGVMRKPVEHTKSAGTIKMSPPSIGKSEAFSTVLRSDDALNGLLKTPTSMPRRKTSKMRARMRF